MAKRGRPRKNPFVPPKGSPRGVRLEQRTDIDNAISFTTSVRDLMDFRRKLLRDLGAVTSAITTMSRIRNEYAIKAAPIATKETTS